MVGESKVNVINEILKMLKKTIEVIAVILFLFFEKLAWEKLAVPFKVWISKLKISEKFGTWLKQRNVFTKFWFFILPLFVAEVMGIVSGSLIVSGSVLIGLGIYVLKIPVAGLTFWIFGLVKEDLLKLDWFETLYNLTIRFLNFIKSTEIYKRVTIRIRWVKIKFKSISKGGGFMDELKNVYNNISKIFKEDR